MFYQRSILWINSKLSHDTVTLRRKISPAFFHSFTHGTRGIKKRLKISNKGSFIKWANEYKAWKQCVLPGNGPKSNSTEFRLTPLINIRRPDNTSQFLRRRLPGHTHQVIRRGITIHARARARVCVCMSGFNGYYLFKICVEHSEQIFVVCLDVSISCLNFYIITYKIKNF